MFRSTSSQSRRRFRSTASAVAATVILAGGVAACSSSDPDPAASGDSGNQGSGVAGTITASPSESRSLRPTGVPSSSSKDAYSPTAPKKDSGDKANAGNGSANSPSNAPRNPGSVSAGPSQATLRCSTADLRITADTPRGAAGSRLLDVVFTNSSKHTCWTRGFPGISMVTGGDGTQLGEPAKREEAQQASTITLKPGQTAYSAVRMTKTGPIDPSVCQPKDADGFRVYPPEETKAAFIRMSGLRGCAGPTTYMFVQPLRVDR